MGQHVGAKPERGRNIYLANTRGCETLTAHARSLSLSQAYFCDNLLALLRSYSPHTAIGDSAPRKSIEFWLLNVCSIPLWHSV